MRFTPALLVLAISLASFSNAAVAALEHPDCRVATSAELVIFNGAKPFDVTSRPEIMRLFDDQGYTATGKAEWKTLPTGALFAELGIICGAQRRYRTAEYLCATSLKLFQRTSTTSGYANLGGGSTDAYSSGTMAESARLATEAALRYVPRCVVTK